MRYAEITESTDPFLYHATRRINLPAITQEGLTPNTDRDSNFGEYPIDGRLFVSTTFDGAKWYADQLCELFDLEASATLILRFAKKGIKTRTDPYGNLADRHTFQGIPPDVIEVLLDEKWVRLSSIQRAAAPRAQPRQTEQTPTCPDTGSTCDLECGKYGPCKRNPNF